MNPYESFSDVLFTCVDGPKADVVTTMLESFNAPNRWARQDPQGERAVRYYAKETDHSISLAYTDKADRDTTNPQRVIFWSPRIYPTKTVLMGRFHDGLSHSISRLSKKSPYQWINVRIYKDAIFPGVFFDYYSNRGTVARHLMACKDEEGWEFLQTGPVQPFEDINHYARPVIKDRFNKEIIAGYLARLGFLIEQDGFWETDMAAILLWQERR
jgi:hypothetical protein